MSISKKPSEPLLVRVFIPEINAQKCVVVNPNDTVQAAEMTTLEKIAKTEKEPENYSLYLPSSHGGPGKFLDEERLLMDYALEGHVPQLELRYKSRDFINVPGMTEKQILKANTKANQKKFVELIATNAFRKVEKALATGIDANFLTDDGNTPLGIACGRFGDPSMILTLVSGGTHIDFRGKDGLLPIHRAAIGGNAKAIKTLLSLGASPNSKDSKDHQQFYCIPYTFQGLTPLYHAVIMGDHPEVCETLLRDYSIVNTKDQHQWTELHHACKYGYTKHVDLLLKFQADISAKNNVGNTPLHVSASHGQVDCAMLLLKRGADKQLLNNAGQPANQVAILCGHHQLSSAILRFSDSEIEQITELPNYNPHAKRPFVAKGCHENSSTPNTPTASSMAEALLNSAKEDEQRKIDFNGGGTPKQSRSATYVPGVRQAPMHSLQKSSSMSWPSRPPPKVNAAAIGIPRDIYINKGPQGYGFAMRGIKVSTSTFKPTPEIPAFQFVGSIDRNGSAEKASLKEGDYLIEANGHNIITSTHDQVVNIIVNSGKKLHLKVVTPAVKPTGLSTIQESPKAIKKPQSTSTPPRHSSLRVSHDIPGKPNAPFQSCSGNRSPPSPQDSVFKHPDMQKSESPATEECIGKPPLIKSGTVCDLLSKPQISMVKQFSEENIRPPSQFDSPMQLSRNSGDDESLSPFAKEVRNASKAREERILTNQPRMLTTTNKQEHGPSEEEESIGIAVHIQTDAIAKQESKTDSVNSEATLITVVDSTTTLDSTDSQEMQQSKDTFKNKVSKVPVSSLIKRFSDDYSDTQEATELTHPDVGITHKNLDKQHPDHSMASTNIKKSKSVTMIAAKTFEGERADDGIYNWRNNLKSVSKPPIVKSSISNVKDENVPTNVCERNTNRQMQGNLSATKTSKTSLLAKKFEQNAMNESVVTKTVEKVIQQNETLIEKVKQTPSFMVEQNSMPLAENSSVNESATSPVKKYSENKNDSEESAVSFRRESAVVMYDEGEINLPTNYERNSALVDTDYWKSPEHATSLPDISELSTFDIKVGQFTDKSTGTETLLPEPELDILPPPVMSVDEEFPLSIEDLPLPELLPPPEIDDFTEFQDLPPPPVDFPDFSQDIPSFDITTSSSVHNIDIFELPSPSQLPPHYGTDNVKLSSPSELPPHHGTNNFELPSPSLLPPHDDADDFELPLPSELSTHNNADHFKLPSPSQIPVPQERLSERDDSNMVPEFCGKEPALESKSNENTDDNEALSDENLQFTLSSSTIRLPSVTETDLNSMPSHLFENTVFDNSTIPSSSLDLSDIPFHQAEEKLPFMSNVTSDENHEFKSLEDDSSFQGDGYKTKLVMEWTVDDVCSWLDEIGLEEHIEMFWDNEIQGSHLVDMTKDDLKELGITRLGHRMTITNGIAALLK